MTSSDHNENEQNSRRFRFTQTSLKGVVVPPGKPNVMVNDDLLPGFCCRVSKIGTFTMLIYKKVAGKPTKKILGKYLPGPGEKTVEQWRDEARVELGKISENPQAWLECLHSDRGKEISFTVRNKRIKDKTSPAYHEQPIPENRPDNLRVADLSASEIALIMQLRQQTWSGHITVAYRHLDATLGRVPAKFQPLITSAIQVLDHVLNSQENGV